MSNLTEKICHRIPDFSYSNSIFCAMLFGYLKIANLNIVLLSGRKLPLNSALPATDSNFLREK